MVVFSSSQLQKRGSIFKSQELFHNFLDTELIHKLINIFDDNIIFTNKISKYVQDERQ